MSGLAGCPLGKRVWPLALAAFVVAVSLWFHSAADPPVTGDEPHYLIYGNSLARGWGIDLERAYQPENYGPFAPVGLDPHAHRYRTGGPLATWHSVGLPVLLMPVLAVRPSPWLGRLVIIVLNGLLAYHLCRLCIALTRASPSRAAVASGAVLLSAPVLWYSGLIFPEIPLALCVVGSLRAFVEARRPWVRFGLASTLAAAAPWFASRILPLVVLLLVVYAAVAIREAGGRRPASLASALAPVVIPVVVLAGGLAALDWYLYGAPTPTAAVGRLPPDIGLSHLNLRFANLYYYGVGGLVGIPSGIFPHGPALLVAAAALPLGAVMLGLRRLLVVLLPTLAYVAYAAYFGSAGYAPPGRYFVPVVPLLAVPLAAAAASCARPVMVAIVGVAVLSVAFAVSPVRDFVRLYRPTVDGIDPVATTARLWPFIDAMPPSTRFDAAADAMSRATGTVEASGSDSAVMGREGRDPAGFLTYGPFLMFPKGEYVARFALRGGDSSDPAGVLALDVFASDEPSPQLAQEEVLVGRGRSPTIELPFRVRREAVLQFRVHYAGSGAAGVVSVSVRPVGDPAVVRNVRGEVWKVAVWLAGVLVAGSVWAARAGRRKQFEESCLSSRGT